MSPKDHKDRRKELVREIVGGMLDDPRFRNTLHEIVALVIVQQRQLQRLDDARSFLAGCSARGITVRLAEDGSLRFNKASLLTPELRAMLLACRYAIVQYLEGQRDVQRYNNRKADARNGTHEAPG